MAAPTNGLDPLLDACRRRRLLLAAGAGLGEGFLLLLPGLLLAHLLAAGAGEEARRLAALLAWSAAVSPLLARCLPRLWARRDPVAEARALELAAGLGPGEPLSAAAALARGGDPGASAWMERRVVAQGALVAAGLAPRRLVDGRPALARLLAAALALLVAAAVPGGPGLLAAAAWPWGLHPPPGKLPVAVRRSPESAVAGADVELEALADAGVAAHAELRWDGGGEERLPLAGLPGGGGRQRLRAVVRAVAAPFSWRVACSAGATPWQRVALAEGPRLASIWLEVEPPAYAGTPSRRVEGGEGLVPAGGMVTVCFRCTGALAAAELVAPGLVRAAELAADGTARVRLRPAAPLVYGLRLVGGAPAVVAEPPQRFSLGIRPDHPPSVALAVPGLPSGEALLPAGPAARLPVGMGVVDDLGPPRCRVEAASVPGAPLRLVLAGPGGEALLDLAALGARPGDRVEVAAVAEDAAGQVARSATLALVVAEGAEWRRSAAAAALRPRLAALDEAAASLGGLGRACAEAAARPADDPARRAALELIAGRIALWREPVAEAAAALAEAGAALPGPRDDPVGPLLSAAGGALAAWTGLQAGILAEAADEPAGRRLCEAARSDLLAARRELQLALARLAAESLAAVAAGDRARLLRGADAAATARLAELPRRLAALADAVGDEQVAEAARRAAGAQPAQAEEAARAALAALQAPLAAALKARAADGLPPRLAAALAACSRHLAAAVAAQRRPGEAGREEAATALAALRAWAAAAAHLAAARPQAAAPLAELARAEAVRPEQLTALGARLAEARRLAAAARLADPPAGAPATDPRAAAAAALAAGLAAGGADGLDPTQRAAVEDYARALGR